MTPTIRHWLPLDVVTRDVVRARLDEAVDRWSTRWFSRARIRLSSLEPRYANRHAGGDDAAWRVHPSGVAIGCPTRVAERLLDWALDAKLGLLNPTMIDRQVLDGLSRAMSDDLARSLELSLGIDVEGPSAPHSAADPFDALGGVVAELADNHGGPLLSAAVPLRVIMPLCRSSLGPADRPSGRLETLVGALGPSPLRIEATLGEAHVSLMDLRGLAPGDVLVLDTALGAPAEISLAGGRKVLARGELAEIDSELVLVLQP